MNEINRSGTRPTTGFRSLPPVGKVATIAVGVVIAAFGAGIVALALGLLWRAVCWAWG